MRDLAKKWWFWVIALLIVIVVGFVAIIGIALNVVLDDIGDLAIQVQGIYSDATIYTSAGDNTIVLELNNWNNDNTEELTKIINVVKAKVNNNELQSYSKLITLAFIKSGNEENALFVKTTYNLPNFTKEETQEYIDFKQYKNLYNTLVTTNINK